jgi:hypothetical protein
MRDIQIGLAPVALFVYKRPEHTKRVLENLSKCEFASKTPIFVFSEGAKTNEDSNLINETRKIVNSFKDNFGEFHIHENNTNRGLAKSIVTGINYVFGIYETCIVLEDDLLVHPQFLKYMNHYLSVYKDSSQVYHISGFQKDTWMQFFQTNTFFSHYMNCWGWATWKDRWQKLNLDLVNIKTWLSNDKNKSKFNYVKLRISNDFELNRTEINTWAIFWYSTILINAGVCLNPRFSLVQNIGDDGTGTNTGITNENKVTNFETKVILDGFKTPYESIWDRIFIVQAYAQKSKIRFKIVKNILFWLFTKCRIILNNDI